MSFKILVSGKTHNFHKQRGLKAQPALSPGQRPVGFGEWCAARPVRAKAFIIKQLNKDALAHPINHGDEP